MNAGIEIQHQTLVYLRDQDYLLLAMKKRGHGQGYWNGVGGKIEAGETEEQGAIRETQEEIIVTPNTLSKVARLDIRKNNSSLTQVHTYFTDTWEGTPTETDEMMPRWFHINNIPYDTMWATDKQWLPHVIQGERLLVSFSLGALDVAIDRLANPESVRA